MDVLELAMRADKVGIKLKMVNGMPTWEGMPSWQHQDTIDRIRESLPRASQLNAGSGCACLHKSDIEAVIEVVSEGYESKDLELGPHFYLMHGVKDVVVFDPGTGFVLHIRKDGRKHLISPVKLHLECGCDVTV